MEDRILVKIWFFLLSASILIGAQAPLAQAATGQERQYIRFYKINKHEQTDRIRFTGKKGRKAGCQNFLKKTRVFKAIQFGYESCQLFSAKGCASGSEISVTRDKDEIATTTLTQGFGWLPESEHKRGVKLRSWNCQ